MSAARRGGPAGAATSIVRPMVATAVVVTGAVLPVFLTGALAVQLREDLGFSEAAQGSLTAAFFGAAALTSFGFGHLAERMGPARSMRMAALISAGALVAVAAGAHSYRGLLVLLFGAGVANAMAQPAANLFVARTVPPNRQGVAFAVKQSAIPASTLLGGVAVPAFGLTVGWRWAYVASAAVCLSGLVLVGRVDGAPVGVRRKGRHHADASFAALAVLGAGVGLGAAAAGGLGTFFVSSAVHAGMGRGAAGVVAATGSAVCVATRVVMGARADRRVGDALPTVAAMLALGSAGYLALGSEAWLIVVVTPLVFSAGWGWPGLFNLAVVQANPGSPGAATGITQSGTYVGAVAGPLAFGWLAEHASYQWAWATASAAGALAAVAIVAGRRLLLRGRVATPAPVGP